MYIGANLSFKPAILLLSEEVNPPISDLSVDILIARFNNQVDMALAQLKHTDEKTLTEFRGVGRKLLSSTVIGLLVHGAEHTMRHVGQLMVTIKILNSQNSS